MHNEYEFYAPYSHELCIHLVIILMHFNVTCKEDELSFL